MGGWKRDVLCAGALILCAVLLLCAGRSCERAYLHPEGQQAGVRVTLTLYDADGCPVGSSNRTAGMDAGKGRLEYRGTLPEGSNAASYVLTIEPEQ